MISYLNLVHVKFRSNDFPLVGPNCSVWCQNSLAKQRTSLLVLVSWLSQVQRCACCDFPHSIGLVHIQYLYVSKRKQKHLTCPTPNKKETWSQTQKSKKEKRWDWFGLVLVTEFASPLVEEREEKGGEVVSLDGPGGWGGLCALDLPDVPK